jgi:hypothetical protein
MKGPLSGSFSPTNGQISGGHNANGQVNGGGSKLNGTQRAQTCGQSACCNEPLNQIENILATQSAPSETAAILLVSPSFPAPHHTQTRWAEGLLAPCSFDSFSSRLLCVASRGCSKLHCTITITINTVLVLGSGSMVVFSIYPYRICVCVCVSCLL